MPKDELNKNESYLLTKLFYAAAWYSSIKSDREKNPKFNDDDEIKTEVINTMNELSWIN